MIRLRSHRLWCQPIDAKELSDVDLSTESAETLDLYGIGENKQSDNTGRACLLARRLSEAGVRFVQVSVQGWDHHVNIGAGLPNSCAQTDKPVAGLLKDLKRRGMLDETLVFWSGEFGRSPWSQDLTYTQPFERHGREHQQESHCCWMAGGGVKGGVTTGPRTISDFIPSKTRSTCMTFTPPFFIN